MGYQNSRSSLRKSISQAVQAYQTSSALVSAIRFGIVLGSLMVLGTAASANTITVDSLNDTGTSSTCVLRDAITAANTKAAVNACTAGSGDDIIVFSTNLTGTIALGSTLPAVANILTINGLMANPAALTIDGGGIYELLAVDSGATLTLRSLTLAHGNGGGNEFSSGTGAIENNGTLNATNCVFWDNIGTNGGAILNNAALNVADSTFNKNSATFGAGILNSSGEVNISDSGFSNNSAALGEGAGIDNFGGEVNVSNSTFNNNSAESDGGAIKNGNGNLNVTESSFDSNSASIGGAISNLGDAAASVTNSTFTNGSSQIGGGAIRNFGTMTVTNSTFTDNTAQFVGAGAILNDFILSVTNSTFSGNSGVDSGAIENQEENGTVTIKGSILSRSSPGNCARAITNGGYNISDDGSCGFGSSTGANGFTIGDNVNPLLDPAGLASNGGPTQTIALQATSPAVDAIPLASCTFPSGALNPCTNPPVLTSSDQLTCDQRGVPRPDPEDGANSACDIGAFELQSFVRFQPLLLVQLPQDFALQGYLALAMGSAPLNPSREIVRATLSSNGLPPVGLTIPSNSFKKFGGAYVFRGKIGRVNLFALITPRQRNSYSFLLVTSGVPLTGISNPVTITLQIGLDSGTQNVRPVIVGG